MHEHFRTLAVPTIYGAVGYGMMLDTLYQSVDYKPLKDRVSAKVAKRLLKRLEECARVIPMTKPILLLAKGLFPCLMPLDGAQAVLCIV